MACLFNSEFAQNFIGGKRDTIKDLTKFRRSKSEAKIISVLESLTGEKFPTVLPKWLKQGDSVLELDGYSKKLGIALEFSGPYHTKWMQNEEDYAHYFKRLVRDKLKQKLCAEHGIALIVVDMSLPQEHWRNYLLSRLSEIRPERWQIDEMLFIKAQVAEPYRDRLLEKELGLSSDLLD